MPTAKNIGIANKLLILENSIQRKLAKFYREKIAPTLTPIVILKQAYDHEVQVIIRRAVEAAYKLGADIVADAAEEADEEFELFISATDVNNIVSLTNSLSEQFWHTAERIVEKEQERAQELTQQTVGIGGHLTALAVDIVYKSYNTTITSKMAQIATTGIFNIAARVQPPIPFIGAPAAPPLPPPLLPGGLQGPASPFLPIGFEIKRITPAGIGKVRFVTKGDAKVDPKICAPLDGMTWEVGDPNIVHPITDTHRHCRCRLEPFIETETGETIDIGFDSSTSETAANE